MSAKYKTDNYLLMGFDEYGGKLFTEITGPGLTGSRESGYERIASGDCASFAISRVLYNSIDASKADRWMPKEKPIKLDPGPLGCVTKTP